MELRTAGPAKHAAASLAQVPSDVSMRREASWVESARATHGEEHPIAILYAAEHLPPVAARADLC